MAQVGVTEASRLIGLSTVTIYRHLKSGKLSRDTDGQIDTSELARVYGALKGDDITPDATSNITANESVLQRDTTNDTTVIEVLKAQVQDLKDRADAADQREERLMKMLESRLLVDDSARDSGIMSKFKKLW